MDGINSVQRFSCAHCDVAIAPARAISKRDVMIMREAIQSFTSDEAAAAAAFARPCGRTLFAGDSHGCLNGEKRLGAALARKVW